MPEAYIVEAVRTAGGRRKGRLAAIHANDLGAFSLNALVDRTGLDPAAVDDVIFGCVTQAGEQSQQVGRNCVLASRLPQSVPAVTIDRRCGSSQQALHFAAQAVMAGVQDIVIAGGVESMTRVPMGVAKLAETGCNPTSDGVRQRFDVEDFSQFAGAEMIARKYGFTREDVDAYSLLSHQRAASATESGRFEREIVPVEIALENGERAVHDRDEGIRFDASTEQMASLDPMSTDGILTAANASQMCDGSSALLVVSEQALQDHGLNPLARVVNMTVTAGDPVVMLEEPLFATDRALQRSGMNIGDIDLFEVNEAFASIPMAWLKHTGADPMKTNVNGGAIALGHPLGATGTKLMATLIHELRARGLKYGLQTMCEGGGTANVTIVEAL